MKYLKYIITVIVTIIVLATAYLGYSFYKQEQIVAQDYATISSVVNQDHTTLTQLITFINQQIQASQASAKK